MGDDVQKQLTAALFEAAAAAMRDERPEDVLRALGERVRSLGLAKPKGDGSPVRLLGAQSVPGAALAIPSSSAAVVSPMASPALDMEPAARRADPYRESTALVFGHWRTRTGHEGARLTPDRVQKVRARLREGYSAADLMRAVDGCAGSPFHSGENDRQTRYDDLSLICRSGSTVERFREMANETQDYSEVAPVAKSAETILKEQRVRELKAEARKLLKAGDTEKYADAIRSIRALG